MRHPDTIPEAIPPATAAPEKVDTSRRSLLRGIGLASVGAAALAAGCSKGEAIAAPAPAPAIPAVDKSVAIMGANESPFGPSPKAIEAMIAKASLTARYADDEGEELKKQIAAIEGVDPQQIFLANGSTPILAAFGEIIAAKGKGQLVTSIATYEGVPRSVLEYGAELITAPLTADFGIDLDAMAARITKKTTATYVCNPNNPTGNMVDPVKLRAFAIEASKTAPCFIDEAYLHLCDDYDANVMTSLLRDGHNVVICRTFSKIYGMAGQRLGYGIAKPELARQMGMATRMGGVNHLGIVAAMASLADKDFVPAMQPKFKAGRERLYNVAKGLGRKIASNPQASFVFFEVGMPNKDFADKMMAEGVRVVGRAWPEYDNWTRICVGEDWEMDRCEAALKKVLAV
ncbi:MAG: histidinol-phosphate aminotransferase family protein [Hyphomonadaceae bacterium]|nr:histidinol-phosphate aminotransferase family protein [Hyphomonadaceae bacterium]